MKAGVIAIGPGGRQGYSTNTFIHPSQDLAIVKLGGELATNCPGSPRGDVDSRPTLRRAYGQAQEINFERRNAGSDGSYSGIEIVPVQIVAVPETGTAFTVRATKPDEDAVVQSDSGSPVRMRGIGGGDSGYPLGLIISVLDTDSVQYVDVLRMDQVRAFHEAIVASEPTSQTTTADYQIAGFAGDTPDSSCSPNNLITRGSGCGWRVQRGADRQFPSITLRLPRQSEIAGVQVVMSGTNGMAGASVAVQRSDGSWSSDRYCPGTAEQFVCRITPIHSQQIRISFNVQRAEVHRIAVQAN